MKIFITTLLASVLFQTIASAQSNTPVRLDCDIAVDGELAKSYNQIQYVEYSTIYGQTYKGHEFISNQAGEFKGPQLKLKFREGEPTLEGSDIVDLSFEPEKYVSATLSDFVRGFQVRIPAYGRMADVSCSATLFNASHKIAGGAHFSIDFRDLENLEGRYDGFYTLGSDIKACRVELTRANMDGERRIRVTISGEGLPPYGGAPVDQIYSENNPISFDREKNSIFVETSQWITGPIGGTFILNQQSELREVHVGKLGPGSGTCQRLMKVQ